MTSHHPFFSVYFCLSPAMNSIKHHSQLDYTLYLVGMFVPVACATLAPTTSQVLLFSKFMLLIFWGLLNLQRQKSSYYVFLFLLIGVLHSSSLWSVSTSRSIDGAIQITYYILLFLLFRTATLNTSSIMWGMRILVGVSLLISIQGLYQHFYGFEEYFQYLDSQKEFIDTETADMTRYWITALSGRVFSKFALPSQLAGYLLMLFPLNVFLALREKFAIGKFFWAIILLMNGVVLFYTKSFGAWLSLLCILLVSGYLLLVQKRAITWTTLAKGSALFAAAGWGILYIIGLIRGQFLWDFQGNNPLWYRFLNWKTAWQIFRDHPFLGTGLFTFGKMYPQYMQPGANETQYVHNTYLQFAAEWGIFGGVLAIGFALWWVVRLFISLQQTTCQGNPQEHHTTRLYGFCFFLGGLGFLLHNGVDFDFYVFPLGALGISLLALALNMLHPSSSQGTTGNVFQNPKAFGIYAIILCGLTFLYTTDWKSVRAEQQQEQAIASIKAEQYEQAESHIHQALHDMQKVAEYHALNGSIQAYLQRPEAAIERFKTAIRYEPITPWFHAGIAEVYLSTYNISLAYAESRRAAELFPQKAPYQKRAQEIRERYFLLEE